MVRIKQLRGIAVAMGLCLVMGISGCGKHSTDDKTVQVVIPEYEKNTYNTTKVQKGSIQSILKLTLQPDAYEVNTYSIDKEMLMVSSLNVEKGGRVKAGEVMVVFENDDIEKHIKEYEERKEENALLIEHYKKLQKIEGKKKYADEIKKLQADQGIADLYIKEQKEILKSYEIRAKKEGVVTMISEDLYKGFATYGTPAIKVASGSSNYTASTSDSYEFTEGDIYEATLNDVVYEMKVLEVNREGDKQNIVFEPVSDMAGITESDTLSMEIKKPAMDNVIYVDEDAILTMDDKQYVFVLDEKGFREAVEVRVSEVVEGYAVISQGIEEGEQVTLQ